jgi:copper chaperone CopZ
MKSWTHGQLFAAVAVAFLASIPAYAQVDKAALRTSGISCGECAAISEIYLRQLPGIDKVTISKSQEVVVITYKSGSSFQPWDIRDALERTDVGVVQFQISARGRLQETGGKKFFVAGKDKFVLAPTSVAVPADATVELQGIVNDKPDPMELKALVVKPLPTQPAK